MSFNILNVGESVYMDDSIANLDHHSYQPYASSTLNNNDEIRIPIQTQNLCTLPSQSYLYIEGKLLDGDSKPSTTINFVNNGILFLFEEIRYELGGMIIDRVRHPGITSTLKGYASFTENECTRLNNAGWSHLEHPKVQDNEGNFSVCIPLSLLLGFAEDLRRKIILNVRQELRPLHNCPGTGTGTRTRTETAC